MDWIDRNRLISILVLLFIIFGSQILFWEIYSVVKVDKKDNETVCKMKIYTDEVNKKSLDEIILKLDTLIEENGKY